MKEGYDRGLSAKRVRSGPLNFVEIQRGRLRLRLPPLPPLGHGGGAGGLDRVPAADGLSFSSAPLRCLSESRGWCQATKRARTDADGPPSAQLSLLVSEIGPAASLTLRLRGGSAGSRTTALPLRPLRALSLSLSLFLSHSLSRIVRPPRPIRRGSRARRRRRLPLSLTFRQLGWRPSSPPSPPLLLVRRRRLQCCGCSFRTHSE